VNGKCDSIVQLLSHIDAGRLFSFRLQVSLLPFQAGGTGPGEEADFASLVLHFPMLTGVVEFDLAGPGDFQVAKFM